MSLRHPVGPLPPAVYWRRRAVVIGVPLVLIGALAYSCAASGGNGSHPVANSSSPTPASHAPTTPITASPGPSTSVVPGDGGIASGGGPSPSTSAGGAPTKGGATGGGSGTASTSTAPGGGGTTAGVGALSGCALRLQVSTDQSSYNSGGNPRITVAAADVGNANCTLNVAGNGLVVSVLTSAGATVWSSSDCPATTDERALGPGDIYTETVTWDRRGSAPGHCENGQQAAALGFYQVQVAVNGLTSAKVPFQLSS